MKIAVPYDSGSVLTHFTEAEQFKIYDVLDDEILSEEILPSTESDAKSRLAFFQKNKVNLIICNAIGISMVRLAQDAGIQVMGGASGRADDLVRNFLEGDLHFGTPLSATCSTCTGGSCSTCGVSTGTEADETAECDGNISACGNPCF